MHEIEIHKGCSCGASFDAIAWENLRFVGYQDDGENGPGSVLELRDCSVCGSTIAIEMEPPERPEPDSVERVVERMERLVSENIAAEVEEMVAERFAGGWES